MERAQYTAMTQSQETQRSNAWAFIFQNWHALQWVPIPTGIKLTLGLHSSLGMCSGMLVTRTGAAGLNDFILRMNAKRGSA
jgi:hypothetical protein